MSTYINRWPYSSHYDTIVLSVRSLQAISIRNDLSRGFEWSPPYLHQFYRSG